MKKLLPLILFILIFTQGKSQMQTIPYCDNFNGATLWTVNTVSGSAWQQGSPNFGTTSSSHTPPSCFDVELDSAYSPNTISYLTSPAFNFTNAFNSQLSFWQNWHTEVGWDGTRMEFSNDSGFTWSVLGTVADPNATNWYNSATINSSWLPAWAGNSGGWIKSTYNLSFLDGYASVIFRFVFTSDPSVTLDGYSIDDFCITMPPPLDAGLEQILEPNLNVPANSSQQVKVRVKNYGSQSFNSFMVSYQLDGGPVVGPINFPLPLTPNSSADVILPNVIIPSGIHTLCAYTTLAGDGNSTNDTMCISIIGISTSTLPFTDNFDGVNNGWTTSAINTATVWELGTPNFGATSSAFSAPNSWDINLNTGYGSSAIATLSSPFFDFTSAVNAKLKFAINYSTETNWDGVRCEYRAVDSIWHVLGAVASPGATNWYTNTINSSGGLPAWAGNSLGWKQCAYDSLNMLNGAADAQFRFVFTSDLSVQVDGFSLDNFEIKLPAPIDVGVELIVSPISTVSAGATVPVEVVIVNYGSLPVSNFNIYFKVDNNTAVGPVLYGSTINPSQSVQINIGNVTIAAGAHSFLAYTSLGSDGDHTNDTSKIVVVGVSTVTLPYVDNFDGADAGWFTTTANSSTVWQLGSPTYGATNSSYSAPNCWDVNLNSGYQAEASIMLTSPYIDFTNAIDARLKFNVNYNTELNTDGVRCEYRANDSIWHLLGNMGSSGSTNWYNTASLFSTGWPGWAGNSLGWKQCEYDSLNMLSGAADVQFRFVFTSNAVTNLDGFSIDNFIVDIPLPNAAGTQAINSTNILLSPSAQYFQALVVNHGLTPLSNAMVSLRVDGSTIITETATFSPPVSYHDSVWYNFIAPWNATSGTHSICTYTSNPNGAIDLFNYDDTTCMAFTVLDTASVFPYCNDFETSPAWPVFNPQTWQYDNLWAIGSPNKTVINSAHSGLNCWVTNLSSSYGNNKSSALISPVFYLQQGHCYKLSFWQRFQTEFLKDGGTVEYSADNGLTWIVVGWVGDPDWFNTNAVAAFGAIPISGWSGLQSNWTFAQHDIYSANGGEYIFRFRFGSGATNNGFDGWAIDDMCFEEIASPCFAAINDYSGNGFSLAQNVPNPASDRATINFVLPANKIATLRILDMLGNVLMQKNVMGSSTQVDVRALAKGVYFYELQYNNHRIIKKMVVVR